MTTPTYCKKCGGSLMDGDCRYASTHPPPRCKECGGFTSVNRSCLKCKGQLIERNYAAR